MERPSDISSRKAKLKGKPQELQRWEGEGGNPPPQQDPTPAIAGILRKLLINWHLVNPPNK